MKAAEQPTLADRFMYAKDRGMLPGGAALVRAVQARARLAEKMVFDAEASYRVGEVLRDIPELLIEQIEFARAPFEVTWIEYQSDALLDGLGGPRTVTTDDPTRDVVVGALIDHNRVNVVSCTADGVCGLLPFAYHLLTEWPLDEQLQFAEKLGVSRLGIDLWLWGTVGPRLHEAGKTEHLRKLRDTNRVEMIVPWPEQLSTESKAKFFRSSAGDFKNTVALLLMLNQPRVTQYVHVGRRRGWIGNQHRPFMAHHSVQVALDAKPQLVAFSQNPRASALRRRHRVRGHYCHDQIARDYARVAGCIHNWQPTRVDWTPWPGAPLDEREHWVCGICEGKRWWRADYERGGGPGYVYHDSYKVSR